MMDFEIDFLRQLGDDLRRAAQAEASGKGRARVLPMWRRRLVVVMAGLLVSSFSLWAFLVAQDRIGDSVRRSQSGRGAPGPGPFGPPPTPLGQELWAVDAISSEDAWAVGSRFPGRTYSSQSLILHWDGTKWSGVPGPDAGRLNDVLAISKRNAWAVGEDKILHWDGTRWQISSHPSPPGMYLKAIDASGPKDVWAVGVRYGTHWVDRSGSRRVGNETLTLHWDGTHWGIVSSPNPTKRVNWLSGVVALSPTDSWAVGYSSKDLDHDRTLTMHWDGSVWRTVSSPNPGRRHNVLWSVGSDGTGGVWAVGGYGGDGSGLYLRRLDDSWEVVPPPKGEAHHRTPTGLSGSAANDVWAVGSESTDRLLLAHWDGSSWSVVDPEIPGPNRWSARLLDVVVIAKTDAWAVGTFQGSRDKNGRTETEQVAWIEHWDGTAWRRMEAPVPSS